MLSTMGVRAVNREQGVRLRGGDRRAGLGSIRDHERVGTDVGVGRLDRRLGGQKQQGGGLADAQSSAIRLPGAEHHPEVPIRRRQGQIERNVQRQPDARRREGYARGKGDARIGDVDLEPPADAAQANGEAKIEHAFS